MLLVSNTSDRKLNIFLVFITQSCFQVQNDVRLNTTHFFIMKIPHRKTLQQIVITHSSGVDFDEF